MAGVPGRSICYGAPCPDFRLSREPPVHDYQRDFMTGGARGKPLESIEHLVRHDVPNILMSHNPNSFPRAAELGVELSLAGHTHGGQVKFEIVERTVSPARLITDFVAGLYRLHSGNQGAAQPGDIQRKPAKDAWLYVNRGLGTFGLPLRLGVPPEITLLTLRSVQSEAIGLTPSHSVPAIASRGIQGQSLISNAIATHPGDSL